MPRRNPHDAAALADVSRLAVEQAGVVTHEQARETGVSVGMIRRLADSGRWQRLHRGVLLTGGGPPGLPARMWAAHLALGPSSVVGGRAAGHYWGLLEGNMPDDAPILMLVPERAHLRTPGLRTLRVPDPLTRSHAARRPPVLTLEHAVLDRLAAARTEVAAVEAVLRACRLRLTTPQRLLAASAERSRLRRRSLLLALCADAADGVTSELERTYRDRVERRHGLPRGRRQVREQPHGAAPAYRDVRYDPFGVLVELDGRLGHETESDVWRDQLRDNAAVLTGSATLRFGWMGVAGSSCLAAAQVEALLVGRGWSGRGRPCQPGCPVGSAQESGAVVLF